jgi:hypothetical protein
VLQNPPLRQAAKRYAPLNTPAKPTQQEKFSPLKQITYF